MATWKIIFPAVVLVDAKTKEDALEKGADRAGLEYFTTYASKDAISAVEIVGRWVQDGECTYFVET